MVGRAEAGPRYISRRCNEGKEGRVRTAVGQSGLLIGVEAFPRSLFPKKS